MKMKILFVLVFLAVCASAQQQQQQQQDDYLIESSNPWPASIFPARVVANSAVSVVLGQATTLTSHFDMLQQGVRATYVVNGSLPVDWSLDSTGACVMGSSGTLVRWWTYGIWAQQQRQFALQTSVDDGKTWTMALSSAFNQRYANEFDVYLSAYQAAPACVDDAVVLVSTGAQSTGKVLLAKFDVKDGTLTSLKYVAQGFNTTSSASVHSYQSGSGGSDGVVLLSPMTCWRDSDLSATAAFWMSVDGGRTFTSDAVAPIPCSMQQPFDMVWLAVLATGVDDDVYVFSRGPQPTQGPFLRWRYASAKKTWSIVSLDSQFESLASIELNDVTGGGLMSAAGAQHLSPARNVATSANLGATWKFYMSPGARPLHAIVAQDGAMLLVASAVASPDDFPAALSLLNLAPKNESTNAFSKMLAGALVSLTSPVLANNLDTYLALSRPLVGQGSNGDYTLIAGDNMGSNLRPVQQSPLFRRNLKHELYAVPPTRTVPFTIVYAASSDQSSGGVTATSVQYSGSPTLGSLAWSNLDLPSNVTNKPGTRLMFVGCDGTTLMAVVPRMASSNINPSVKIDFYLSTAVNSFAFRGSYVFASASVVTVESLLCVRKSELLLFGYARPIANGSGGSGRNIALLSTNLALGWSRTNIDGTLTSPPIASAVSPSGNTVATVMRSTLYVSTDAINFQARFTPSPREFSTSTIAFIDDTSIMAAGRVFPLTQLTNLSPTSGYSVSDVYSSTDLGISWHLHNQTNNHFESRGKAFTSALHSRDAIILTGDQDSTVVSISVKN
jgi:hypothetical protein